MKKSRRAQEPLHRRGERSRLLSLTCRLLAIYFVFNNVGHCKTTNGQNCWCDDPMFSEEATLVSSTPDALAPPTLMFTWLSSRVSQFSFRSHCLPLSTHTISVLSRRRYMHVQIENYIAMWCVNEIFLQHFCLFHLLLIFFLHSHYLQGFVPITLERAVYTLAPQMDDSGTVTS